MFGYMFSGLAPFDGLTNEEIMELKQRGGRPSIEGGPRSVPAMVMANILEPMLNLSPYERPEFSDIKQVLEDYLGTFGEEKI